MLSLVCIQMLVTPILPVLQLYLEASVVTLVERANTGKTVAPIVLGCFQFFFNGLAVEECL